MNQVKLGRQWASKRKKAEAELKAVDRMSKMTKVSPLTRKY